MGTCCSKTTFKDNQEVTKAVTPEMITLDDKSREPKDKQSNVHVTGMSGGSMAGGVAVGIIKGNIYNNKQAVTAEMIAQRTDSAISKWTRGMVKTSALLKVKDKLKTGATWITIKGNPGEGKTTVAYMALEELHQEGRQVFKVNTPDEYRMVSMNCPKPVIMLDDILGDLEFDKTKWSTWQTVLDIVDEKEHRSHEKETSKGDNSQVTLIVVGRDNVFKTAASHVGKMAVFFTEDTYVIDMLSTAEREVDEKLDIFKAIAGNFRFDEQTMTDICHIKGPHGFPHTCRLFVTMLNEGVDIEANTFFKAPLMFLNQTIEIFMRNETKLALFKEMMKREGKISPCEQGNMDKFDIIEVAETLVGSYLKKEDGCYVFNHPSIYDSVAFNLCKHHTRFVIENCHLSFIHE